jgi:dTDP-4-dehydrorhamnose 3,5-epimerase
LKISTVEIEGLKVIDLDIYSDHRGYFIERFHTDKFKQLGLPHYFFQDNLSRSQPNVLRGLHYQINPYQGKLVGAIRGRIWDVAVDLRKNSSTFGQHFSIELSDTNGKLLWIPGGFAHGFYVLGDEPADVLYKVDCAYDPKKEGGIRWDDPDLNISWPGKNPILSGKDIQLPSLHEFIRTNKSLEA